MAKFVWYDVMTSDAAAAQYFYHKVMDWTVSDSGLTDRTYMILSKGPAPIGGLMPMPEGMITRGTLPCWFGYIGVDDVDAYVIRVTEAGGEVYREPQDIPNVGRFSVVADPYGASFILFEPSDPRVDPQRPPAGTPGHIGWHELHTSDPDGAFAFYQKLFGWKKGETTDMGPMGLYQQFITDGDMPVGGMFGPPENDAQPVQWRYYFNVENIEAAVHRVREHGGKVMHGPHQVPGGTWVAQCIDPQGADFALSAAV